jgi:hypothetical protein
MAIVTNSTGVNWNVASEATEFSTSIAEQEQSWDS